MYDLQFKVLLHSCVYGKDRSMTVTQLLECLVAHTFSFQAQILPEKPTLIFQQKIGFHLLHWVQAIAYLGALHNLCRNNWIWRVDNQLKIE